VLALFYLGDMTVQEVAATLGIAPGTVKSRLSRGREALVHSPELAGEVDHG
jgi:RNA polymerase sigma-70 factor (ECF subfamily)